LSNGNSTFIAVEGLDYSGKTTVAKLLAQKIGGQYYKVPPKELLEARQQAYQSNDIRIEFRFEISAILFASRAIAEMLAKGPVVADRYLYLKSYHESWARILGEDVSGIVPEKMSIQIPDCSFYLEVSEQERIKRMENALKDGDTLSTWDRLVNKNFQLRQMIRQGMFDLTKEFNSFPDLIQVDTSEISPEEICNHIIAQLPKDALV